MSIKISAQRKNLCLGGVLAVGAFCVCLVFCACLPAALGFGAVLFAASLVKIDVRRPILCALVPLGLAGLTAVFCFLLNQYCVGVLGYIFSMVAPSRIVMNLMVYFAAAAVLYALTGRIRLACLLTLALGLALATADVYLLQFRGSELKLIDLLSLQTALNVAGNYRISADAVVIYSWLAALVWAVLLLHGLSFTPPARIGIQRLLALGLACFCVVLLANNTHRVKTEERLNMGSSYNGFILNFLMNSITLEKPEDYDSLDLAALEEQYAASAQAERTPHILVIMDEAFSDLRVFGDLNTNISVMPFFDSLEEDSIKGYALSSVYGGNTANSEWEFLTGNTMAFLPSGSVAYLRFVENDTYSLATYLKSLGYYCIATHPYIASGWMRTTVWPYLNFDEVHFAEDYPWENLVRDYVSDQEMFEQILETLKNNETSQPLFLFGVTMQNHGDYDYDGDNFTKTISLEGYSQDYPMAEQYLSLIHETDAALEYLITGLQELDEDVIVLFYGDHQPKIESDLLEELYGGPLETLEADELRYAVPFLIWANFDIPEDTVTLTSLNYLSNPLLEAAGISLPSYNRFLRGVEAAIPAMNARGYYSAAQQAFLDYDDASGEEAALLELYQNLQYHSIKETENRSTVFFPFAQS